MINKNIAVSFSLSFLLIGCAGKLEYSKPKKQNQIKNSLTINKGKKEVWDNLIPKLAETFFVINNIEKDSGFINISYSGNPEKYVDCGRIYSYVKNAQGERTYDFPAAKEQMMYETLLNGQYAKYDRRMYLDGRANIILQEIEDNKTLLSINTKYLLKRENTIYFHNGYRFVSNKSSSKISFNTNGKASFPSNPGKDGTTCYSNGKLEKEIINIINQ